MIPKKINPESYYDVKLTARVKVANADLQPRHQHRVKGKVLSAILADNKDAVAEAVEV